MLAAKTIIEQSRPNAELVYTISPSAEQSTITDKLGIFGSTLCLIHCLLLPVLLPLFSASSYSSHVSGLESWFHDLIFPALLLVAALAFSRGYKIHHSKTILCLGVAGIIFISLGLFSDHESVDASNLTTPIGSFLLVIAHLSNISKLKRLKNHVHSSNCGCGSHSKNSASNKLIQLQNIKN